MALADDEEAPQISLRGTRKQRRRRGASSAAMAIYDALYENPDGLTRDQLLDECMRRFPKSGTIEWFHQLCGDRDAIVSNKRTYSIQSDYRAVCDLKMRYTLNSMRAAGQVVNEGTTRRQSYKAGKPPKYWQPRHIRPGHFRDYVPDEQRQIAAKQALRMRWPAEARAELARAHPRSAQMRALLEQALTLLD